MAMNKTNLPQSQSHEKNHRFIKEKSPFKNVFAPSILTIVNQLQDQVVIQVMHAAIVAGS
jgi:hypothetical protein